MIRIRLIYAERMELTRSYELVIPPGTRSRYDFIETRNAAAVLASTDGDAFGEVLEVLAEFSLTADDITEPGKNKSRIAIRLDRVFREKRWREAAYDTYIRSVLRIMPYRPHGERTVVERQNDHGQ